MPTRSPTSPSGASATPAASFPSVPPSGPSRRATPSPPTAGDVAGRTTPPVVVCLALGTGWLLYMGYVYGRWVTADYFGPTDPGPDPVPGHVIFWIRVWEGLMFSLSAWVVWECILKPWRRDGAPSSDGILAMAWGTLWMHDVFLNWTVHVFSYNAHAVNVGNWTAEVPGWLSPRSQFVPEPLLGMGMCYFGLCTLGCWVAIGMMQKAKERWPGIHNGALVAIGMFTGMLCDWVGEHTMISFQLMSYLGVVPELTLMPGSIYQFPLYEAFFFGGVIGFTGVLMYFKDDHGHTWAERGIDRLRISRVKGMKTFLRWVAMVGIFHTYAFFLYSLPMQIFSINSAPFPEHVPSYLLNGVCGADTGVACNDPAIAIPRRVSENLAPGSTRSISSRPVAPVKAEGQESTGHEVRRAVEAKP